MNKNRIYQTPRVLQEVCVLVEREFLKASVVDDLTVVSVGQEVEDYDFSIDDDNPFTITWGEE